MPKVVLEQRKGLALMLRPNMGNYLIPRVVNQIGVGQIRERDPRYQRFHHFSGSNGRSHIRDRGMRRSRAQAKASQARRSKDLGARRRRRREGEGRESSHHGLIKALKRRTRYDTRRAGNPHHQTTRRGVPEQREAHVCVGYARDATDFPDRNRYDPVGEGRHRGTVVPNGGPKQRPVRPRKQAADKRIGYGRRAVGHQLAFPPIQY